MASKRSTRTGNEGLRHKLFGAGKRPLPKASVKSTTGNSSATKKASVLAQSRQLSLEADSASHQRLPALLRARGINEAVACEISELLREAQPVDVRRLLAGLARHPEFACQLNSGKLRPADFVAMDDDALATPEIVESRQAAAIAAARPLEDGCLRLQCPECAVDSARGSYIHSAAFSKPQLGRAQMVLRGECVECGHVWLAGD